MKNLFIQKEKGKCLFYNLANLFNDEKIIKNGKDHGYHMDLRRIIESKMDNLTAVHWLLSENPIKNTKVFQHDTEFSGFSIFFASAKSLIEGQLHSLLIFSNTKKDELIILDPHFEYSFTMRSRYFLNYYDLIELETIADIKEGQMAGFNYTDFKHLLEENEVY